MEALLNMTTGEMEGLLSELKEKLDEAEEERTFVLNQTGHHVPGVTVKNCVAEVNDLRRRIEEIKKALLAKKTGKE